MKKIFSIILCIGLLFIVIEYLGAKHNKQEVLKDIAKPSMNGVTTVSDSWYFFKRDRIYAYVESLAGHGMR